MKKLLFVGMMVVGLFKPLTLVFAQTSCSYSYCDGGSLCSFPEGTCQACSGGEVCCSGYSCQCAYGCPQVPPDTQEKCDLCYEGYWVPDDFCTAPANCGTGSRCLFTANVSGYQDTNDYAFVGCTVVDDPTISRSCQVTWNSQTQKYSCGLDINYSGGGDLRCGITNVESGYVCSSGPEGRLCTNSCSSPGCSTSCGGNGTWTVIPDGPTNTPIPTGVPPLGFLDTPIYCDSGKIHGWACDGTDYSLPVTVHIYKDGQYIDFLPANITAEQGVCDSCGGTCNHRFEYTVPSSWKDCSTAEIRAYAIDIGGANNRELNQSPQTYGPCQPSLANPQNLTCSIVGSTLNVNWGAVVGADSHPIRVDDTNDDWGPGRSPPTPCELVNETPLGDYCAPVTYSGTSFSRSITSGHDYNIWVHGYNSACNLWGPSSSVSCNSSVPPPVATLTPYFSANVRDFSGGVAIGGNTLLRTMFESGPATTPQIYDYVQNVASWTKEAPPYWSHTYRGVAIDINNRSVTAVPNPTSGAWVRYDTGRVSTGWESWYTGPKSVEFRVATATPPVGPTVTPYFDAYVNDNAGNPVSGNTLLRTMFESGPATTPQIYDYVQNVASWTKEAPPYWSHTYRGVAIDSNNRSVTAVPNPTSGAWVRYDTGRVSTGWESWYTGPKSVEFRVATPTNTPIPTPIPVLAIAATVDQAHVCEDQNREVHQEVVYSDTNGFAELDQVSWRLLSGANSIILDYYPPTSILTVRGTVLGATGQIITSGDGNDLTATWTVTIPSSAPDGDYLHYFRAVDDGTDTGWVQTDTDFLKVWDCLVKIHGALKDLSSYETPNCSLLDTAPGFAQEVDVVFAGQGGLETRTVRTDSDGTYSQDGFAWSVDLERYQASLALTDYVTEYIRVGDPGECQASPVYTFATNETSPALIDPYSADPSVRVDFGVDVADTWFQVVDGVTFSKGGVSDLIPELCQDPCVPAISYSTDSNGPVFANGAISKGCTDCVVGNPHNLRVENANFVYSKTYDFAYFDRLVGESQLAFPVGSTTRYYRFSETKDLRTILGETGLESGQVAEGERVIVLVDGDVEINTELVVVQGGVFTIVSSGTITVLDDVNRLDGIYVANRSFVVNGSDHGCSGNDDRYQLKMEGAVVVDADEDAVGSLTVNRNLLACNATIPAFRITYRPDFIWKFPAILGESVSYWKEVTP